MKFVREADVERAHGRRRPCTSPAMRLPHPVLKVLEEARLLGPSRLRPDRMVEVVVHWTSFSTVLLGCPLTTALDEDEAAKANN